MITKTDLSQIRKVVQEENNKIEINLRQEIQSHRRETRAGFKSSTALLPPLPLLK